MLASEIISRVRQELVETIGAFWTDAQLLDLLNKGERAYQNEIRLLDDTATLTTTIGQANYPLPANWVSARAVFYDDTQDGGVTHGWKRINPSNLEKISQERPDFLDDATDKRGTPSRYWIWGREIRLHPTPDKATNLFLFYKSKAVTLTSVAQSINTDDSLADAIEEYMLWKAWKKEKEFDLAAQSRAEYEAWIGKGRRWVKKQAGDQKLRIDLESSYPFTRSDITYSNNGNPLV